MDAITCVYVRGHVRTQGTSRFGLLFPDSSSKFLFWRAPLCVCVVSTDKWCDGKTGLKKMQQQCAVQRILCEELSYWSSSFLIEERRRTLRGLLHLGKDSTICWGVTVVCKVFSQQPIKSWQLSRRCWWVKCARRRRSISAKMMAKNAADRLYVMTYSSTPPVSQIPYHSHTKLAARALRRWESLWILMDQRTSLLLMREIPLFRNWKYVL